MSIHAYLILGQKKLSTIGYFQKDEGSYFAKKMGKKLAGAILFKMNDNQVIIDLVVVDSNYRGKKVASSMINYLKQSTFRKLPILVGSQERNTSATNLYLSSGFNEIDRKTVYHYFNKS